MKTYLAVSLWIGMGIANKAIIFPKDIFSYGSLIQLLGLLA
jgi:hypothetical protein